MRSCAAGEIDSARALLPLGPPGVQACQSPDEQLAQALRARCSFLRRPGLHVVHIACEMAPIAKVRRGRATAPARLLPPAAAWLLQAGMHQEALLLWVGLLGLLCLRWAGWRTW